MEKCSKCGAPIENGTCSYCGTVYTQLTQNTSIPQQYIQPPLQYSQQELPTSNITMNQTQVLAANNSTMVSSRNKGTTFLLAFFFGMFGIHYFYVGRFGKGLLYFFTLGLFGVGWFIDIVLIFFGSFKDSNGLYIK